MRKNDKPVIAHEKYVRCKECIHGGKWFDGMIKCEIHGVMHQTNSCVERKAR